MYHFISHINMLEMRKLAKLSLLWIGSRIYGNNDSKVLFYHDIYKDHSYKSLDTDVLLGTPIDVFKQHINVILNEGYEIVPKIIKPQNQVSIMFDDGFRGIWDNRHYFREKDIRPTVFLAVDLIGKEGFLTKEEILELQNGWNFTFQCHSWHHVDLTKCNDKQLEVELKSSREELSKLLGKEVTSLCLPRGYFSDKLLNNAGTKEYLEVYSSIPGSYDNLIYGMRRRNLCQFSSATEVKYILRGGNEIIKNRYVHLHHQSEINDGLN